jgi:hypothetical protein
MSRLCVFADDRCTVCHRPTRNVESIRVCSGPPGLGDRLASALESIGITKARVSAALGVKDCGCAERQSKLNALGRKLGIGVTDRDAGGEADRTASAPSP